MFGKSGKRNLLVRQVARSSLIMAFRSFLIWFVLFSYCYDLILSSRKPDDSLIKAKVSYEPIFTTDGQFSNSVSEDAKSRGDRPATKNSVIFKQKISNKPIFTTDSQGYNFLNDEDGKDRGDPPILEQPVGQEQRIPQEPFVKIEGSNYGSISKEHQRNRKGFWGSNMKKVLAKNRKENFNKLQKSDDGTVEDNTNGSKEWDFIYKPFDPSKTKTSDTGSSTSSKSAWSSALSKVWSDGSTSSRSLSRSSTSSSFSSSTSESDSFINSLLDKYDGKNYYGESVETAEERETSAEKLKKEIGQREGEELPVGKFTLCSEVLSPNSNLQILDIFADGKSSTCILACLFYKIKFSKFYVRPEGRCTRLSMSGPGFGQPKLIDLSCVCNNGMKGKYRYLIIQQKNILYHVISKEMGTKNSLGTTEKISQYVEDHFRTYLKNFLKNQRGIDWKEMYEYVRDFRWLREYTDDRPVGQYLSDSLKEDLDDIHHFWTITVPDRLLKWGIHHTGPGY